MHFDPKTHKMKWRKMKMKLFKGRSQLGEGLVCQTEEFRFHLVSNWESLRYLEEHHLDTITDQMKWIKWRGEKSNNESR